MGMVLPGRWCNVIVVVMFVRVLVRVDGELGRRQSGAQDTLGVDVHAWHGEASERPLQVFERKPGVDERANRHVAGDARKAIEVQQFHGALTITHHPPDSLKLQYLASPSTT